MSDLLGRADMLSPPTNSHFVHMNGNGVLLLEEFVRTREESVWGFCGLEIAHSDHRWTGNSSKPRTITAASEPNPSWAHAPEELRTRLTKMRVYALRRDRGS
jgi:hypothetical protein